VCSAGCLHRTGLIRLSHSSDVEEDTHLDMSPFTLETSPPGLGMAATRRHPERLALTLPE
jgi:hypothetical protein